MAGKLKPRRGKAWNPAKDAVPDIGIPRSAVVTNRRAQEFKLPDGHAVADMEVDDPFALNPGDKVVVVRSLRADPLAQLHTRGAIDEAQYAAGRAYQRDFECAGSGLRAFDYTKVVVEGGLAIQGMSDAQDQAMDRLMLADDALGPEGVKLIEDALIHSLSMTGIAAKRGLTGNRWEAFFSQKLKVALEALAVVYGQTNFAKRVPDVVLED